MKKSVVYLFCVVSLLLCAALVITCKKEYSYEGGLVAQYNFAGSPDTCMGNVVNGTYTIGTATTDSVNNVQLFINVTAKGRYDIKTAEADGISFSASGEFPDTCTNCTLSLSAQGTPDSAGTYSFPIPGTNGCAFSVTVAGLAEADFTLSGAPDNCANPVNQGRYIAGINMNDANLVTINVEVDTPGTYNITTPNVNGFSFSASGIFTSPGAQQVILKATGTPGQTELSQFPLNAAVSHCTFYIPVSNMDPIATYVLQSGIQNNIAYCTPGSVQGVYTAGTALNAGNTLTVNAYVTVAGNFTIATIEQNGMKFYHTGTFTVIGTQDVILQGSGTPQSPAVVTFYPEIVGPAPLGGSTCGLDVNVK